MANKPNKPINHHLWSPAFNKIIVTIAAPRTVNGEFELIYSFLIRHLYLFHGNKLDLSAELRVKFFRTLVELQIKLDFFSVTLKEPEPKKGILATQKESKYNKRSKEEFKSKNNYICIGEIDFSYFNLNFISPLNLLIISFFSLSIFYLKSALKTTPQLQNKCE